MLISAMLLMLQLMLHFLIATPAATFAALERDGYVLLIDAGSTGSRSFVFHITERYKSSETTELISRVVEPITSTKIKRGISTFADLESRLLVDHFAPMFLNASRAIPEEKWKTTQVFMKGTAGMRLLSQDQQNRIWENMLEINDDPRNPFYLTRDNLGTIDGDDEAYYAVLASNYIAKSINGLLLREEGREMVGALDMGGSSTQLIFYVGEESSTKKPQGTCSDTDTPGTQTDEETPDKDQKPLTQENFWSYSWLNFGVELVRERVQNLIIRRFIQARNLATSADETGRAPPTMLQNPCTQSGYVANVEYTGQYYQEEIAKELPLTFTMRGFGNPTECRDLISNILWPDGSCTHFSNRNDMNVNAKLTETSAFEPCYINNVKNPPVQGHFYGMSVYYFANDAVRTLGDPSLLDSWPSPTVGELNHAADKFCEIPWPGQPGEYTSEWSKKHAYSGNSQLPHRCFETLYMSMLLEHGFGFDPEARHLTLALDMDGHEVEWTLGFTLANVKLQDGD